MDVHRLSDFNNNGAGSRGETKSFREMLFPQLSIRKFVAIICIIHVLVYIASLIIGQDASIPEPRSLYILQANYGPAVAGGEVWRIVSSGLLHGSFPQLAFNVLILMGFGIRIENAHGSMAIVALYCESSMFGALMGAATGSTCVAAGAAVGTLGVLGFHVMESCLRFHLVPVTLPLPYIWTYIIFPLFMVFPLVSAPHLNLLSHFGGFLGGACLGNIYNQNAESNPTWWRLASSISWAICILLIITSIVLIGVAIGGRCGSFPCYQGCYEKAEYCPLSTC
eukprot:Filipodium_phascolosomae@DN2879_c0_g1_i1.p1